MKQEKRLIPIKLFVCLFSISLVSVVFTGCFDSTSSIQGIPKLILDRPEEKTKIFITSQNAETRYEYINITIDNETSSTTNTYGLEVETPKKSFELFIEVLRNEHSYHFHGNLSFQTDDEEKKVTIKDFLNHNRTIEENIPYKQLLESK